MTSTRHFRGAAPMAVALLAALTAAGCGYSSEPLHRTDVRTVAVDIFGNKSFRREMEFGLARALVKTIEMRTPYKVVHDPKRADSEIRGEIFAFTAPVLTESVRTDSPMEVEVTIMAWFEWKDLRTGEILRHCEEISGAGSYAVALGETQDSATEDAIQRLARRIVEFMEKPW
ncbi:MAG: LPS assembly lipoprotein LptE [Planctomycetota bacterium]|nr:LPS assembly lipoprotein LptE [Planctomycetota bacterium]